MFDTAQVLIEYDAKGNILSKSDVGEYAYGEDRPFAVESIKVDASLAALHERLQNQDIEYTPFQRVESIGQVRTMDGKPMLVRAEFAYNPDLERMTMTTTVGDKPAETQFYFGDYEEKQIDGRTVQYCYVQSPAGLLAVAVKSPSGSTELYYAATDYLGSIRALVTGDGKVAERFEFDPWGRRRNPYTHQPLNSDEPVFPSAKSYPDIVSIERGFCGQEHLDDFDLINLNARLYDPILGRFLSPDPFVQQPDNTQNLNRYAYALNNSFNYMDPSGTAIEGFIAWGVVAFAAVIGGVVNVAVHAKSTTYVWQDFANFGIGFLISGISSMTGYGIAGLADKAGFIWGGLIGGLSGAGIAALTSPLQTGLNNLVAGSPFGRNMGKNVTTDILMGFAPGLDSFGNDFLQQSHAIRAFHTGGDAVDGVCPASQIGQVKAGKGQIVHQLRQMVILRGSKLYHRREEHLLRQPLVLGDTLPILLIKDADVCPMLVYQRQSGLQRGYDIMALILVAGHQRLVEKWLLPRGVRRRCILPRRLSLRLEVLIELCPVEVRTRSLVPSSPISIDIVCRG